jgi:alpha-tubulin suppressor-like RCC1 family protein
LNADDFAPDDFEWSDLIGNAKLIRDLIQFKKQLEDAEFLVACTKRHFAVSEYSKNLVLDLRVPLPAAPVLTVTENDPELAVTWTQEETGFSGVYLERSLDGITFTPLANLAGDATSYDDAAVTVGVEYFYRARNRRCGVYSPYSNIDSGQLVAATGYSAWSWGRNDDGQLGVSDTTDKYSPTAIGTPALEWVKIAGGRWHTAGIKSDGSLWTWGEGLQGELGDGNGSFHQVTAPVQIDAGPWSDVDCGQGWTFALKADGTLWGCGENGFGQLAQGDSTDRSTLVQMGVATNWTQITCTHQGTAYALNSSGQLWGCGQANGGQLGSGYFPGSQSALVQIGSDMWTHISGGAGHISAIKSDGTIWESGDNTNPAYPGYHQMGSDSDWVSSSAGSGATIAKKSTGTLWGVGANAAGQLGVGDTTARTSYTQIGSDNTWDQYVIGSNNAGHTLATKTDGTLWAWGFNDEGQHGRGTTSFVNHTPAQVGTDTHWGLLAAGLSSSFGLRDATAAP